MKLVMVDWIDSHSGHGWQDKERIKEAAILLYCKSVGWIIAENKHCIVVVPHISFDKNGGTMIQGLGDIAIPKKAIVKIKVLKGQINEE